MLDSTVILCYNKQENIGEGRRLNLRTGIFFFFNMGHITKVTRLALALMTAAILLVKRFACLPPVFLLAVAIAAGGTVYFASMAAMGMKWSRRGRR